MFNQYKISNDLVTQGFSVFEQKINNLEDIQNFINTECNNKNYERGANCWPKIENLPLSAQSLISGADYNNFFLNYDCSLRDVCITKETLHDKVTRNN